MIYIYIKHIYKYIHRSECHTINCAISFFLSLDEDATWHFMCSHWTFYLFQHRSPPAIHPKQFHPVMWGEWHPFQKNAKRHANICPTRTCPLHSLEPWEECEERHQPTARSFNWGDHRGGWIDMDEIPLLGPWNAPKKQWGQWLPEPICGTWPVFSSTKRPMKIELENGYHQHPIVPIVTSYRRNGTVNKLDDHIYPRYTFHFSLCGTGSILSMYCTCCTFILPRE